MNIEDLVTMLAKVLPTEGQNSPPQLFELIKKTLLTNPADPEYNVNKVEELLINAIQVTYDTDLKNIYKLALKLVLFSCKPYTDQLDDIQKTLLQLPHLSPAFNPDNKNPKYPHKDSRTWKFINEIRIEISNLLDQRESSSSKMEDKYQDLIGMITDLLKKHRRFGPDSSDQCTAAESEAAKKLHTFKLDYLSKCLDLLKTFRVFKSSTEHTLWASAVFQAREDLLSLESEKKEFAPTPLESAEEHNNERPISAREKALDADIRTHLTRLRYYISRAKATFDPLGYFAELDMSELSPSLLNLMLTPQPIQKAGEVKDFDALRTVALKQNQDRFAREVTNFTEAQALIMNYKLAPDGLNKVFAYAALLKSESNSLGHFLQQCALTLIAPPNKEAWSQNFSELQTVVIPACWAEKVGELWLCLSEYFMGLEAPTSFYKDCAIQCARQISLAFGAYGDKAHLEANIQLAKLYNEQTTLETLENELKSLKSDSATNSPTASDPPRYGKESQYQLCRMLQRTPSQRRSQKDSARTPDLSEVSVADFSELMRNKYPFGLEQVIKLLQKTQSPQRDNAEKAVVAIFGNSCVNPLVLCETVLSKTGFSRYRVIWGTIYQDALKNGYLSEETNAWLRQGLSKNDIEVKLYGYIRSCLFDDIYTKEGLVNGGYNYLTTLDINIYTAQSNLCKSLEEDTESGDFKFCQPLPGAIYAVMAEAALHTANFFVADLLAKRSISAPGPDKPKKDSLSAFRSPNRGGSDTPVTTSSRTSPETVRRPKKLFGSIKFAQNAPIGNGGQATQSTSAPALKEPLKTIPRSSAINLEEPPGGSRSHESSPTKRGSTNSSSPITPLNLSLVQNSRSLSSPPSVLETYREDDPMLNHTFAPRLGYLILAVVTYHNSIKRNPAPSASEMSKFNSHLKAARRGTKSEVEKKIMGSREELCYAKALIWFYYFENSLDQRWITPRDIKKFNQKYAELKASLTEERNKIIQNNDQKLRQYTAIILCKEYLLRALEKDPEEDNPYFQMYPPAAVFFVKFLWVQIAHFEFGTTELNQLAISLARLLKICIETHGHVFAEYALAEILIKHTALFKADRSLTDMYLDIQRYFRRSERFITIDPSAKFNLHRQLMKELESEVFASTSPSEVTPKQALNFFGDNPQTYPPEPAKFAICTLSSLPFTLNFQMCEFNFQHPPSAGGEAQPFCLEIIPNGENATESLNMLYQCYLEVSRKYRYIEKVSFTNLTPVRKTDRGLEIPHLDIAILGFIKIIEGDHGGERCRHSQVVHLVRILVEAKSLDLDLWHGKYTRDKLIGFLNQNLSLASTPPSSSTPRQDSPKKLESAGGSLYLFSGSAGSIPRLIPRKDSSVPTHGQSTDTGQSPPSSASGQNDSLSARRQLFALSRTASGTRIPTLQRRAPLKDLFADPEEDKSQVFK